MAEHPKVKELLTGEVNQTAVTVAWDQCATEHQRQAFRPETFKAVVVAAETLGMIDGTVVCTTPFSTQTTTLTFTCATVQTTLLRTSTRFEPSFVLLIMTFWVKCTQMRVIALVVLLFSLFHAPAQT
jgi:hypothetical protein